MGDGRLTGLCGVGTGSFATEAFVRGLPVTLAVVLALLLATFGVGVRLGRHSVVDIAWGLGFVAVALTSFARSAGQGDPERRVLVTVLTVVWGVRLAAHLAWRSRGAGEDPRYQALLARAPGSRSGYALRHVYLTQALVLWFVSLPVQVAHYQPVRLGPVDGLAALVCCVGLAFETVGDWQLRRFRSDPANRHAILDTGLWRFTRHPNYFGDTCLWWGLFLLAAPHWPGVLTVGSPVLLTYLLVRGSGKPVLERRLMRTRPGYADYCRRTSGFLPRPPRRP